MNDEPTLPEPPASEPSVDSEPTVPVEASVTPDPAATPESATPAPPVVTDVVTAPTAAVVPPAVAVAAAEAPPVSSPPSPWTAAGTPNAPAAEPTAPVSPAAPPVPAAARGEAGSPRGGHGPGWRQFLVGALVGALVGGGVAAGVSVATRDDTPGPTKTVVVGPTAKPVENTSVIGKAEDVQAVLAKVNGAVVAIQVGSAVDQGLFSGNNSPGDGSGGAGTGFVISPDGVIVTNSHVVAGANGRIEVEFPDGTKEAAELLGRAPEYDLAVIKVNGKDLPYVKLGNSDAIQVGDQVVAVGNALALQGGLSVTQGIISGKGRVVPEDETGQVLYDMLQTDAAINPGNSGGPLLNANGEVIGINTALAGDSQNVGFAISIDSAKSVIESLRAGKSVRVAFLGVETSDVTPAIAKSLDLHTKNGAVIRRVTKGAAADDAGLQPNDVIIAIGGRSVSGPQDVGAEIRRYSPGDKVDVTVERNGSDTSVSVTLGARPDSVG